MIVLISKQLNCLSVNDYFEINKKVGCCMIRIKFPAEGRHSSKFLVKNSIFSVISVKPEIVKIFMPCKNSIIFTSQK